EHHKASGLDDLWSLGVMTYKLLTTTYPFQGRNAVETERAILHEAPEPPHERNPRVPGVLSELCLRLLEKEPGARYPDARALHAALKEMKRGADETWKVPLYEARNPDAATTRHHPRRGEPWPVKEVRAPRPTPRRLRTIHLWVVSFMWLSTLQLADTPTTLPVETPRAALPREFFPITLEPGGQEVAPPWMRPEGDGSAAPSGAATPAPVASATLPKDSQRVKTARNAPPPREEKQQAPTKGSTAGKTGLAAVCTLLSGCSSTQVRPQPEPADCPAEAVKAMEELGVFSRTGSYKTEVGTALTAPALGDSIITVRGGPATVTTLETTGKLPVNSTLSGQLIVGEKRVYGRFTEAMTPQGKKFRVCFQFVDLRKPGAPVVEAGPGPDLARITAGQLVNPVTRFE
ncbi:MAG TPA: hypothetical protein VEU50_14665, partial [Archangium sp.]|nr:hypothetical protein [Archangium sp.]